MEGEEREGVDGGEGGGGGRRHRERERQWVCRAVAILRQPPPQILS